MAEELESNYFIREKSAHSAPNEVLLVGQLLGADQNEEESRGRLQLAKAFQLERRLKPNKGDQNALDVRQLAHQHVRRLRVRRQLLTQMAAAAAFTLVRVLLMIQMVLCMIVIFTLIARFAVDIFILFVLLVCAAFILIVPNRSRHIRLHAIRGFAWEGLFFRRILPRRRTLSTLLPTSGPTRGN